MPDGAQGSHELPTITDASTLQRHTPLLLSPPETKTPPTEQHKRNRDLADTSTISTDPASDPISAMALTSALRRVERQRETTPGQSPSRKRPRTQYGGERLQGAERPDR